MPFLNKEKTISEKASSLVCIDNGDIISNCSPDNFSTLPPKNTISWLLRDFIIKEKKSESTQSSESMKQRYSPLASESPLFRAEETPPFT